MRTKALLLTLLLSLGSAQAQLLSGGTRWEALPPAQREVLAPLADQWSQLEPAAQDTWVQLARRYPSLSTIEQQRLRERMQQWARLSPAEREQARRAHAEVRQVAPQDRAAKWERFQTLPPERKQALMERAAARRAASEPAPSSAARPLQRSLAQLDEKTLLPRRAASAP